MWLLIDDERNLNTEAVARTPAAGRKLLAAGGWECLCLDHDLAAEESGYDVLVWALERGLVPSHVQLVTRNPVGRQNMWTGLEAAGYTTRDGMRRHELYQGGEQPGYRRFASVSHRHWS